MLRSGRYAVIASMALACSSPSEPEFSEFTVRVDAIEAPTSADRGEAIPIHLRGTIGPDLCHSLARVDIEEGGDFVGVEITVFGRVPTAVDGCPGAISELDHDVVLSAPTVFPFQIRVRQPDGSVLLHVVDLRAGAN